MNTIQRWQHNLDFVCWSYFVNINAFTVCRWQKRVRNLTPQFYPLCECERIFISALAAFCSSIFQIRTRPRFLFLDLICCYLKLACRATVRKHFEERCFWRMLCIWLLGCRRVIVALLICNMLFEWCFHFIWNITRPSLTQVVLQIQNHSFR